MFDFGLTLKKLREERGYSQAQMSRKLNVSKSSVSKHESNQSMPVIPISSVAIS